VTEDSTCDMGRNDKKNERCHLPATWRAARPVHEPTLSGEVSLPIESAPLSCDKHRKEVEQEVLQFAIYVNGWKRIPKR